MLLGIVTVLTFSIISKILVKFVHFRGFAEDAEDEGEINVTAVKESWKRDENAYYYKDPKKALRTWLEVSSI